MAVRYTPEELKHLRSSPLVVKPPGLPPAEQWMGLPSDSTRNTTRLTNDRAKSHDSTLLLDQNRRPGIDRHMSRNSANPEDIILGPPKTSFMSATSIRNPSKPFDSPDRPSLRDLDSRDRYSFRGKGDGDSDRMRDGRGLRIKRAEGDQDSEGWSTVKPRKSFGTEGAERFNGRMGVDRHKEDRRFKDREDRDVKERPRGFDTFSREKDPEHDQEKDNKKPGLARGRNEPSWFRDSNKDGADAPPAPRDRNSNGDKFIDRNRGWREKDSTERVERGADRGDRSDRRWDRDRHQREEREPEWMDEPGDEKAHTHTQEDFQKWKELMQGKDKSTPVKTPAEEQQSKLDGGGSLFLPDKQKVDTPLAIDTGPDKFFGMWSTPKDEDGPDLGVDLKEGAAKAKTVGKASRFTSFFTPQEEPHRRQTEPPPPLPAIPVSGFEALFHNNAAPSGNAQNAEKEAFQQILQKLQLSRTPGSGSTPPTNMSLQPKPPASEKHPVSSVNSPEPFHQYRQDRQDDHRPLLVSRNSQHTFQDVHQQRQVAGSQPAIRPEQMLQDLVGQRQMALSQASVRPDQPPSRNSNTDFLMGLMQSAKAAPEPQRSEQALLRMPPKSADRQLQQQMMERDQEMQREAAQRERSASQRRPGPPPGLFDDSYQRGPLQQERHTSNPPQPTQILQRPPPGLDLGWDRAQLPPQHRINQNIPPPPGLLGAPNRNMPVPQQQLFPPGFANFPPPDAMVGPPRNMQMQPPPGLQGYPFPPPPGAFMPPGLGGYQGPEGLSFGPYDGRGPPPQGSFRRQ